MAGGSGSSLSSTTSPVNVWRWSQESGVDWHYIARASRSRTPSSSFNGRLCGELLNETLFGSLAHARLALAEWRIDYNTVRPHSSLGNLAPVDYAKLSVPASQRDGTLRAIAGAVLCCAHRQMATWVAERG